MRQKFFVPILATVVLFLALPAAAGDLGTVEQTVQSPGGWNFRASVDLFYATRENGDNYVIIEDTVTGSTLLDSDDLSFGWEPGLDARLDFTDGKYGGGIRFLAGLEFDDTKSLTTSPIWNFPTIPPLFGLGAANLTSAYESSLDSVELNVSRSFGPRSAIFVGVRSIMLDEKLTNAIDFGGNVASVVFEADTFAIGPQIGGELHFGDRVFVDVDGRIGALVADSGLLMNVRQQTGPAFGATGDQSDWIMAAEGGVALGFKLSQSVSARAGYRLLYLDGVTTAPSIVDKTEIIPQTISATSEDILIHGVTLGLKVVY